MRSEPSASHRPWVITGAAGFLGSHLVEQLLDRGRAVLAVDNLSTGPLTRLLPYRGCKDFTLAVADIRDIQALTTLFLATGPQSVVHLAALHFIPAAVADPPNTVSLNVHGTQSVLTAARAGVPRFWFASTGDVYAPDVIPHREESPVRPFNIYGVSKWMGEELVALESSQRPEAVFVVGRFFNLYGPRDTNPHFLPEIFKQCREHPQAPLRLGNLWPRRDMVPVADAARAIIDCLDRALPGITTVNVASGRAASMQELVRILGELLERPLMTEPDPTRMRPVDRNHLQADVTRLRELIGWTPHADLARGLAELLAWEGLI